MLSRATLPVLIVGAGPVGLYTALLLQKHKIPFRIFDKNPEGSRHPKAHYLNMRTVEIFREVPGLKQLIDQQKEDIMQFRYYDVASHAYDGQTFHTFDQLDKKTLLQIKALSFEQPIHLPQNKLVDCMRRLLRVPIEKKQIYSLSIKENQIDIFDKDDKGSSPSGQGKWVLVCQGVHSNLRRYVTKQVFSKAIKPMNFWSLHFKSQILGQAVKARCSMLSFIFNANLVGTLVRYSVKDHQFVLHVPSFANFNLARQADPIQTIQSLTPARTLTDITLLTQTNWSLNAFVAQQFSKGPIFIAGDAAHSMPPAGGLGLNTGLQDAHNWVHNFLDESLERYSRQRKKVAEQNLQASIKLYQKSLQIANRLGANSKLLDRIPSPLFPTAFKAGRSLLTLNRFRQPSFDGILFPMVLPQNEIQFSYTKQKGQMGRLVRPAEQRERLLGTKGVIKQGRMQLFVRSDGIVQFERLIL